MNSVEQVMEVVFTVMEAVTFMVSMKAVLQNTDQLIFTRFIKFLIIIVIASSISTEQVVNFVRTYSWAIIALNVLIRQWAEKGVTHLSRALKIHVNTISLAQIFQIYQTTLAIVTLPTRAKTAISQYHAPINSILVL